MQRLFKTLAIILMAAHWAATPCLALPLSWRVDLTDTRAQTFTRYHGETLEFEPVILSGGQALTNLDFSCIYYQTNGMDGAWWQTDSLTFHPTNDCGAAAYRFFVNAADSAGKVYTANGLLRLLDSPGFEPAALQLPVRSLDFSTIEVLNAPWPAQIASATNDLDIALRADIAAAQSADYATVSNRAMNAASVADVTLVPHGADWSFSPASIVRDSTTYTPTMVRDKTAQVFRVYPRLISPSDQVLWTGESKIVDNVEDPLTWDISSLGEPGNHLTVLTATLINPCYTLGSQDDKPLQPAGNYASSASLASATNSLAEVAFSGSYIDLVDAPADPSAKIAAVSNRVEAVAADIPAQVLRIVSGTNIVLVCTNYNSTTHLPSIRLEYLPEGASEYSTLWDLEDSLGEVARGAAAQIDSATNALAAVKADRAWGKYTSAFGVDAPEGETWISSSNTVFAAGHDFAKTVTASGEIFTLVSSGLLLTNVECPTNAAFFSIAANNEELYRVEKTDSRVVDVSINAVNAVGPYLLIDCTGWLYPSHPLCRVRADLQSGAWLKEEDYTDGLVPGVAQITWLGTGASGDPYICQVENLTGGSRIFAGLWYEAPGQTKVIPQGVIDLSAGLYFNGNVYYPTVNSNKLEFVKP